MSSLNFAQERAILARGKVGQVGSAAAAIYPVYLRLRYVGTGSVTSVVVTTGTNVVTTSTGTNEGAKTYAFATYTNLGLLADKINADGIFEARILDGLRSFLTTSTMVNGTITIGTEGYYDLTSAPATSLQIAYRLTWSRATPSGGYNPKLALSHRVHLQEIDTNLTLNSAIAAGLIVTEFNPVGQIETQVFAVTPTTGSTATINWASGQGKITAQDGNDLIVSCSDLTTLSGTLTVIGVRE